MRLAASVRGRAASSRHGRARDEARRDTATPHDVFSNRDHCDELRPFDRLGLVGHRQQTGDAAAYPVILPSGRSWRRKPPEIGERQCEQPLGPDRRRDWRQARHFGDNPSRESNGLRHHSNHFEVSQTSDRKFALRQ
jgi:hypothetical protein